MFLLFSRESLKPKTCPGVPAGPPPALTDYDDSEGEAEAAAAGEEAAAAGRSKRIRFDDEGEDKEAEEGPGGVSGGGGSMVAPGEESGPQVDEIQKKMLMMAGQDVDQYMKQVSVLSSPPGRHHVKTVDFIFQMEEVHKQTQAEKAEELQSRLARLEDKDQGQPQPGEGVIPPGPPAGAPPMRSILGGGHLPPHMGMGMHGMPPPGGPRPPPILYRPAPPPLRPGMAPSSVRLPPGPPPGRPPVPPGPPPGRPPMAGGPRMPPGPPPGAPSRQVGGVVSAAPQLNKDSKDPSSASVSSSSVSASGVIEAKPQMRNLKSDITRFVPTNVKIRREGTAKKKQSGKTILDCKFKTSHKILKSFF